MTIRPFHTVLFHQVIRWRHSVRSHLDFYKLSLSSKSKVLFMQKRTNWVVEIPLNQPHVFLGSWNRFKKAYKYEKSVLSAQNARAIPFLYYKKKQGKFIKSLTKESKKMKVVSKVTSICDKCLHSSEKRGLRSTNCSSKTLQNLLYFMYKKIHVVFFVFHFVQLYFFPYVYVNIDQGIHKGKSKVARNEKRKKLHVFFYA